MHFELESAQYSKEHFAKKEKIARAASYTQAVHLHQSHDELLKKLGQVQQEIEECAESSVKHFTDLLRDWLVNQVIKEDMLMKLVLKKHQES